MKLAEDLQNIRNEFLAQQPVTAAAFDRSIGDLSRSGILDRALKVGDRSPTFDLPNCEGGRVALTERTEAGPVVINFYRGGWCPFCTREMQALQNAIRSIEDLGAHILAISPQSIDGTCRTVADNHLTFDVLSDEGNAVARQFGIVFHLQDEIQSIYSDLGLDLPVINADDSFDLPVPATFILDRNSIIRFAFVDADYTRRLDPQDIAETLRAMKTG